MKKKLILLIAIIGLITPVIYLFNKPMLPHHIIVDDLWHKMHWPTNLFARKTFLVDGEYPRTILEALLDPKDSTTYLENFNDIKKIPRCALKYEFNKGNYYPGTYLYDWHNQLLDPYSRESLAVMYYPLYNRETLKRESFVVLSAGPDSVQNNRYVTDTLYFDDWHKKLKVYYIKPMFLGENYVYSEDKNNSHTSNTYMEPFKFSCYDKLFGKKDLVLYLAAYGEKYNQEIVDREEMTKKKMDSIDNVRQQEDENY